VTHGHSKDHRPDLKQVLLSVLGNREGFPLWENGRKRMDARSRGRARIGGNRINIHQESRPRAQENWAQ